MDILPPDDKREFLRCIAPIYSEFIKLLKASDTAGKESMLKLREKLFDLVERLHKIQIGFNIRSFVTYPEFNTASGQFYYFCYLLPRYPGVPPRQTISGEDFWRTLMRHLYAIEKIPLAMTDEDRILNKLDYENCMQDVVLLMYHMRVNFFMAVIENNTLYYLLFSQDGSISYSSQSLLECLFSNQDIEFLNLLSSP